MGKIDRYEDTTTHTSTEKSSHEYMTENRESREIDRWFHFPRTSRLKCGNASERNHSANPTLSQLAMFFPSLV